MRLPIVWVGLAALLVAVLVGWAGSTLLNPPRPLILHAAFAPERITPDADGDADVTQFDYALSQPARVTLTLTHSDRQTYTFRADEPRVPHVDYSVLFSGVVDGYVRDGEPYQTVLRRLVPNGTYTWALQAVADDGTRDERSGTLEVADGDNTPPVIASFDVSPRVFSPNQDGIRDRVQMNVVLARPADLSVTLVGPDGLTYTVPRRANDTRIGAVGRHLYDYDGGIDQNADPPPDGDYTVVVVAQDAVGQQVERRATLSIRDGGKPFGGVAAQPTGADVVFVSAPYDAALATMLGAPGALIAAPDGADALRVGDVSMALGDVLVFLLVVENYGAVPLRTHGAPPGTVYAQTQRAASLGGYDESGGWRVGIECDTSVSSYPYRWRLGSDDALDTVTDADTGATYDYLPVGARAVVWGGIRMTELIAARNPQNCWAGLIHEDVAVVNQRVGARSITLVDPSLAPVATLTPTP